MEMNGVILILSLGMALLYALLSRSLLKKIGGEQR